MSGIPRLTPVVLKPTCPPSEKDELPRWLENLAHATLAIDCLFVVEIPLDLYAFGPRYYGLSLRKPAVQREFPVRADSRCVSSPV